MADELQTEPAPATELSSKDEERVSVASNWKLVWWRFRKNRLAVASAFVLIVFYAVVLVPDFFGNQDPEVTDAALAFIPAAADLPSSTRRDFSPSVPAVVGKRNPGHAEDGVGRAIETSASRIGLFVRGYKYKVLGLIETNIHLIDARDPDVQGAAASSSGTDRLGRDQWSRLMFGTRTSMTVGLIAVVLSIDPRRSAGRHLRLFRRLDRHDHPARDRAAAVAARRFRSGSR